MLPASHRLKKDAEIKRVFDGGRSVFGEYCGLKYIQNGMNSSRFAIVVGKKTAPKAVDRNKIKRRIRAILAKKVNNFTPGHDVVLMARASALKVDFKILEDQIYNSLMKAKLCVG